MEVASTTQGIGLERSAKRAAGHCSQWPPSTIGATVTSMAKWTCAGRCVRNAKQQVRLDAR